MTRLLHPSVFFMSRLRYPAKFTLIALMFLTPLAVVMYFFQREINTNIDFARNERDGVAYDLPVTRLLHDTLLHQSLTNCYYMDKSVSEGEVRAAETKIAEDIKSVDTLDNRLGVSLKTSTEWKKLKDKWQSVQSASLTTNANKCLDAHTDVVNAMIAFITTVGNNSQLILDPDLDSYYSMDIAITQLPQVAQNLSKVRDLATGIAQRHIITPDERTVLTVLTGQISSSAGTVESDLQQAIGFNKSIKTKHEIGDKPFQATTAQFLDQLSTQFIKAKKISASPAHVTQAGNSAIDSDINYHANATVILDDLLAKRLHTYEARRACVDVIAVVSLLLAIYLLLGFYRSTVYSVQTLLKTAKSIAGGDFNQTVNLGTRDEIGQLGDDLQGMMTALGEMAEAAERIADGDLSVSFAARSERDALGIAFIKMTENLRQLVGALVTSTKAVMDESGRLATSCAQTGQAASNISHTIQEVAAAAGQSATASQEMAADSEQSARSAAEAADAMGRLHQAVSQVMEAGERQQSAAMQADESMEQASQEVAQLTVSSQQMAATAQKAATVAQKGGKAVEEIIESMGRIQDQVQDTSATVTELGKKGQEIGAIVETISQISEQTNLLALNAAIEAARAGDAGKGFAVVADEVRKLAERAADATKEISSLVGGVRAGVERAVHAMETTCQEVADGAIRSKEAGTALTQILQVSQSVASEVQEVTATAAKMESSVQSVRGSVAVVRQTASENERSVDAMIAEAGQVSGAITTVAAVSERTAAASEEMSAAAQEVAASAQNVSAAVSGQTASIGEVSAAASELEELATRLKELVSQFKVDQEQKQNSPGLSEVTRVHRKAA